MFETCHSSTASTYNTPGTAYKNLGDYTKVLEFHDRYWEFWRKCCAWIIPTLTPHTII